MSSLVEYTCPLDIEDGLARAGGEMDFYRELLDLFLDDVPPRMVELRAAAEARDGNRLAAAAHGIKGAAANLSAIALRDCAYQLEQRGRAGDLDGIELQIVELEEELSRLTEFVHAF